MEWLELLHDPGCPLRMDPKWRRDFGPLTCRGCGREIEAGQLFLLSGRCAMGGAVALGASAAAYADLLQPQGEHLRCLAQEREPSCLTVGHGTRSAEEFLELLSGAGVRVLADIRTVPKSRHNPQHASEALAKTLPEGGICYLHLPELGGLRKPHSDSPNTAWRNDSFRGYADYMLTPAFAEALEELIGILRWRPTAIMCAESVYWRCHRSLVADALVARGIPTEHLMDGGKRVPHTLRSFAQVEEGRVLYPGEQEP